MQEQIKEIDESSMALGDLVAALSSARDMAQRGERNRMYAWIGSAEIFFKAFTADCRVICAEREGESCSV